MFLEYIFNYVTINNTSHLRCLRPHTSIFSLTTYLNFFFWQNSFYYIYVFWSLFLDVNYCKKKPRLLNTQTPPVFRVFEKYRSHRNGRYPLDVLTSGYNGVVPLNPAWTTRPAFGCPEVGRFDSFMILFCNFFDFATPDAETSPRKTATSRRRLLESVRPGHAPAHEVCGRPVAQDARGRLLRTVPGRKDELLCRRTPRRRAVRRTSTATPPVAASIQRVRGVRAPGQRPADSVRRGCRLPDFGPVQSLVWPLRRQVGNFDDLVFIISFLS